MFLLYPDTKSGFYFETPNRNFPASLHVAGWFQPWRRDGGVRQPTPASCSSPLIHARANKEETTTGGWWAMRQQACCHTNNKNRSLFVPAVYWSSLWTNIASLRTLFFFNHQAVSLSLSVSDVKSLPTVYWTANQRSSRMTEEKHPDASQQCRWVFSSLIQLFNDID